MRMMKIILICVTIILAVLSPKESLSTHLDLTVLPILHWSFDEGEGDLVFDGAEKGNLNDGWFKCPSSRCELEWVQGKMGTGIRFDGEGYIEMVRLHPLNFGERQDFTIVGWLRTGPAEHRYQYIFRTFGPSGFLIYINPRAELVALARDESTEVYTPSRQAVDDGQWHHFAMIYDRDGLLQVYLDGQRKNAVPMEKIGVINPRIVRVGQNYEGTIDDIRIYEKALNSDEIRSLFELQAHANSP